MSKEYLDKLHHAARPSTFQNARDLRRTETLAEKILWECIRNRKINGRKFRRQHAMADYVLDFYCHECRLAIELDGNIHDEKMNRLYDSARTAYLAEIGITVLRFRNEEVINGTDTVVNKIAAYLVAGY
jgi:very-short-patch-repair endonuclease